MVGNSLRGVEEEIGVFSTDVDDDGMLFPCLDFTLRVREMFKDYRVCISLSCFTASMLFSVRLSVTYVCGCSTLPGIESALVALLLQTCERSRTVARTVVRERK